MKILGFIIAAGAGADVGGIPSWIAALLTLGGGFSWLRFYWLPKTERRLQDATAREKEMGGDRISVDTAEEVVKFARTEFDRITEELGEVRENYRRERIRADDAHQALVRTQTSLSAAQAQLAEGVARASTDRASLARQVHLLEEQLHLETQRCSRLSDELDTVKAQMGTVERRASPRRSTDAPARHHRTASATAERRTSP